MKPIANMNENLRGCGYMALSMFCFVVNDAFVRMVGSDLPIGQILFIRGGMLVLLIVATAAYLNMLHHWVQAFSIAVLARAVTELVGAMAFLYALMRIPFANASAILQCLPLAVTLGALLFFSEKIGLWRWSAIIIGFVGVMIIIRPGMEGFSPASLWLLLTVICATARDLIARTLPGSVPTLVVSFSTAAIICAGGGGLVAFSGEWAPISSLNLIILFASAVFLFGAYQFIVICMRIGDVGFIAPFRYTSLLWAVVIGWLAFGEWPDTPTIVGSLLIISMGLLTLYRETRVRRRQLAGSVQNK